MSMMVSFVLSFFPRDVLDEILNLIGSVSEGFSSYSTFASSTRAAENRSGWKAIVASSSVVPRRPPKVMG